jgi:hypothetical protein
LRWGYTKIQENIIDVREYDRHRTIDSIATNENSNECRKTTINSVKCI